MPYFYVINQEEPDNKIDAHEFKFSFIFDNIVFSSESKLHITYKKRIYIIFP